MKINIIPIYNNLQELDFRILLALELNMKYRKWVPVMNIKKYIHLSTDKIIYRLGILSKYKIVGKSLIPYEGYTLYILGYSFLSLRVYIKRGIFQKIGYNIKEKKNAVLFEVKKNDLLFSGNEKIFILKINQSYNMNLKDINEEKKKNQHRLLWTLKLKKQSKYEYEIMKKLYPAVSIPKPIDYNRNTIVFEKTNGYLLSKIKLRNPIYYLNKIL